MWLRDQLVILCWHLVRCEQVARTALPRLKPEDFDANSGKDFRLIWSIARDFWIRDKCPPNREIFCIEVQSKAGSPGYEEPEFIESALALVNTIYNFKEDDVMPEFGMTLLKDFMKNRYFEVIQQVSLAGQGQDSSMINDLIQEEYVRSQVSPSKIFNPADALPSFIPREPTGVTFLDAMLNGGTLPGECYGILGPSGGGKTMMAIQIFISLLRRGQHAIYCSYEQDLGAGTEVHARFTSCLTGIRRDLIEGKNWEDMDVAIQDKISEEFTKVKPFAHMVDKSTTGDSVSDIEALIQDFVSQGKRPRMVIIDWIYPLVLRQEAQGRGDQTRKVFQKIMEEFKGLAGKYGINILILHQLSVQQSKSSPGQRPEWFNAAEAGSFAWLLNFCFAIGRADANGLCWFIGSKTRGAAKSEALVHLNGAFNRFDPTDNRITWEYDMASKAFVDSTQKNKVDAIDSTVTEMGANENDYSGLDLEV